MNEPYHPKNLLAIWRFPVIERETMSSDLILTIDTAIGETHLGLFEGNTPLSLFTDSNFKNQSGSLVRWIEELLRNAGKEYKQLQAIATTTGPGGFTSIRIGLATARALSFSLKIPVYGFTTLQVMASANAAHIPDNSEFLCLFPSGREQWFAQSFRTGSPHPTPVAPPHLMSGHAFSDYEKKDGFIVAYNPNKFALPNQTTVVHWLDSHPAMLAALAQDVPNLSEPRPGPIYVRPPDAIPPRPRTE